MNPFCRMKSDKNQRQPKKDSEVKHSDRHLQKTASSLELRRDHIFISFRAENTYWHHTSLCWRIYAFWTQTYSCCPCVFQHEKVFDDVAVSRLHLRVCTLTSLEVNVRFILFNKYNSHCVYNCRCLIRSSSP